MSFHIIDNALSDDLCSYLLNKFDYHNGDIRWYDKDYDENITQVLNIVGRYFDLSDILGYEIWCNDLKQHAPSWHYDKDEKLFNETGQFSFPKCSIVYYAMIHNLEGGDFTSKDLRFTPITNRLVAFSPGIEHHVYPYTGMRFAVSINPWSKKPSSY
jgi:hypothetical protein